MKEFWIKNLIINLLVILYIIFPINEAVSQPESVVRNENAANGPQISFERVEYDFGNVEPGEPAFHNFVFVNKGTAPLVISNVRTSCGCTVPDWTRKPILTGAKDSVRVEYNTRIKGAFNKTVTVHSNGVNAVVELRIRGNVVKEK